MTKVGYKMTEIGEIPQEWGFVKLGDVLSLIKNGVTYKQNKKDSGYPVTRIETISEEKIDTAKVGYIDNIKTENINDYRLIEGDILFSHINSLEHIGKTAIYEGEPELLLHGMNLLLLRSDKSKIEPSYLVYSLKFYRAKELFKSMAKRAVNQASINQTELKRIKIPLPPLPEQQKIAEILSTADDEIQKMDEQIALAEQLKKGLMQKLLTRGIGHTRFKTTEIGEIPEEWDTFGLGEIFKTITGTTPSTKVKDYWHGGTIEWLTPKDLNKLNNTITLPPSERKVTEKALKENNLNILPENSILISTRAPVGYVGINNTKITFNQGCKGLVPLNRDVSFPFFYAYYLKSKTTFLNSLSTGSTFKELSKEGLDDVVVPLPPLPEQQKIGEILSTVDNKLELLGNKREKLNVLKKGLMNDLFTGKVRVKV
ncbi:restriction endonuclease subunit S [Ferroplasma acidarmanus]|uniref:Type I restriction modification DNA specificity domain-containing protein n=1 Tax=Ferroplasma acidarmanus Fer1 TaxID=333146 RepID=S0ATG7_FERAC|nr:restriction endonuclease subunit S [Ferroplasma acidarmanus]AGO61395.1 hypothetical protein FACI_IFERC00001G1415 [Ferroplasma acidarmanus Fer1]